MKLDKKKEITEEIREKFSRAQIVILTDYKGLNVEHITDLRQKLRQADVEYKVVKNTLLRRAAPGTPAEPLRDSFVGPSAVAMSYTDPAAPAKVLTEFAKTHSKFEIRSAAMAGELLSTDAIKQLSSLPSREILLGQVLSVMNAVPTSFVRVLSEIPRQMLNVLTAIRDQKTPAA
jgi:large subunit ribosomal protein L10